MMEILISILIVIGIIAICGLIAWLIYRFEIELVWCYISIAFLLIVLFVSMVAFVYQKLF